MKKRILILLTVVAVIGGWLFGYHNRKSTSNLPQLSALAQMDEAEVNELLTGYFRHQLRDVLGDPDARKSDEATWVWPFDNQKLLYVHSNNKEKVVMCSINHLFEAEVLEVKNGSLLVQPTAADIGTAILEVPTQHLSASPEPDVGDILQIEYSGNILETYPARLQDVSQIQVLTDVSEISVDRIPMVMVGGVLYLDTGKESTVIARCGMMDGEITSSVDLTQIPTVDDQSNFGTGHGYQFGPQEGTIELYMNGKWWVYATENTIFFHDKAFQKSELSAETLEWLKQYNALTWEEQLAISYIPTELHDLCGYPTAEETEAATE